MGKAHAGGLYLRLRQSQPIPLDAELACNPGELLALVGPSGSGKTTILRCIAGLHRPAEGVIACNGEQWCDTARRVHVPPQSRRVGMVFQSYALFPHFTALDNVTCALGRLPYPQRVAKARDWLARVHLHGLEMRRPAELSGGQQQRVALARALARGPAVLLLDEPFSAVDQVTRRKLVRELAQLRSQLSMPIVLVTHDLSEARMLADVMCILHHGATLQHGPPEVILTRPVSAQVARQIDVRNLFVARVAAHDAAHGTTLLDWQGFRLDAAYRPEFAVGAQIAWMVPNESVVLHRRDRPSRGERENPVAGIVTECLPLGEITHALLRIGEAPESDIAFSVPTHVARRNGLAVGITAVVSLLRESIHLMPAENHATSPEGRAMLTENSAAGPRPRYPLRVSGERE